MPACGPVCVPAAETTAAPTAPLAALTGPPPRHRNAAVAAAAAATTAAATVAFGFGYGRRRSPEPYAAQQSPPAPPPVTKPLSLELLPPFYRTGPALTLESSTSSVESA